MQQLRIRGVGLAMLVVVLAVCAGLRPVQADTEASDGQEVSVGIYAGALLFSDSHEFYDPGGATYQELDLLAPTLGLRLGYLPLSVLGAELEAGLALPTADSGDRPLLTALRAHLIGQYAFGRVTPFAVAGMGWMSLFSDRDVLGDDTDPVAHVGVGLKYGITDALQVRGDARLLLAPKGQAHRDFTTHGEILVGLSYRFGSKTSDEEEVSDRDGDGISDDLDECPDEVGPEPSGCPARDPDGDGIVGAADACPDEAETVNDHEDEDGCPDEIPDSDGDGLADNVDQCPQEAEDVDTFEDEDGCPDTDNDGDQVADRDDRCALEAGPAENKGCPDTDRDGDTVVDRLDNCPDEKGTVELQGCTKKQLVTLNAGSLKILDKVYFKTGKDVIQRRSYKLLDNVADVIKNHSEIAKIQIEGHTDDVGSDELNNDLSERRAEAVKAYLVSKGVDESRLAAKGYGNQKPAAEGQSAKARRANRRVEFIIIE